ncbi:exodeoxyribonuclease V subunit alpha, partial [Francisella tularensis subsp. holarctica]|nr:exodeoxyribonuclease V subunit alpha [Francisella tularensis subsp. holarctica]
LLAIQLINQNQQRIALLAPTCKAAQRMTESLKNTLATVIPSRLTTESTIQKNDIFKQVQDELNSVALFLNNLEAQTIHRFL